VVGDPSAVWQLACPCLQNIVAGQCQVRFRRMVLATGKVNELPCAAGSW
jgi:hypothetical protein